jgi:hypothetical protein
MPQVTGTCIVFVVAATLTGCITAAPGAKQVKITNNPGDVSGCTAVGNISGAAMSNLDPLIAQNLAVSLNANVIFRTGADGIAYRCGGAAAPAQ